MIPASNLKPSLKAWWLLRTCAGLAAQGKVADGSKQLLML